MHLNDNQVSKFLFVFEGIGAVFAGAFLIAYLLGLPTDVGITIYHSDPALKLVLSIFGGILVLLILVAVVVLRGPKNKE